MTVPFLAALQAARGVRAAWIERIPGVHITGDREQAMTQLRPWHEAAVATFAGARTPWWRAEQVHGHAVAVVPGSPQIVAADGLPVIPAVDSLLTGESGVVLAIYVADCGVIWLADRRTGAIGLVHSGKAGTQAKIFEHTLARMSEQFGTYAQDVTAVLGPCIRPPDYEVDFAGAIADQAGRAGVGNFIDCGLNTASDLARFYSYRKQQGTTGRMLALIVRDCPP